MSRRSAACAKDRLVEVTWDALPGRVWKGEVETLPTVIVQRNTRNVGEVTCIVDNSDLRLLPNTNVTVAVIVERQENVLTVPRESIHQDSEGRYVFQVVNGELKRRNVQTGGLGSHPGSGNQRIVRPCRGGPGSHQLAVACSRDAGEGCKSMKAVVAKARRCYRFDCGAQLFAPLLRRPWIRWSCYLPVG